MVSFKSSISWCDGTLNAWVGCTPVSAGCDNCYAATLINGPRGAHFGQRFEDITLKLERLKQIARMTPRRQSNGQVRPYLCFVNSVSDFWHDDVPEAAIHEALDAFEQYPNTVFQILSKRPVRARKIITGRYGNRGVPEHIWFGFSAEDNRVAGRLNILRKIKERVGSMVAFVSVEPIVGPTDQLDFTGCDWVITGGESGPKARIMLREWLLGAVSTALKAGIPLWHKQSGRPASHPNWSAAPERLGVNARFQWLIDNGLEHLPDEKGGATIDGKTYRQLPAAYDRLTAALN